MTTCNRDEIEKTVTGCLESIYADNGLSGEITSETPLVGSKAELASLQLVSFIIDVETEVNDMLDASLTLADEKAMSRRSSPFRSVGTLVDYIIERVNES